MNREFQSKDSPKVLHSPNSKRVTSFVPRNVALGQGSKETKLNILSMDAETQTELTDLLLSINLWKQYNINKSLKMVIKTKVVPSHSILSNVRSSPSVDNLNINGQRPEQISNFSKNIIRGPFIFQRNLIRRIHSQGDSTKINKIIK